MSADEHRRDRAHPRPGRADRTGSRGGAGAISSRYSRIASDWVSGGCPVLDEGGDRAQRVDLQETGIVLLALDQVHRPLLGDEPFQVHRDTYAVGRGRAPEGKQLETGLVDHGGSFGGERPCSRVIAREGDAVQNRGSSGNATLPACTCILPSSAQRCSVGKTLPGLSRCSGSNAHLRRCCCCQVDLR